MKNEAAMTQTDARDIVNHSMHFGAGALCRKRGGKWWVEFRTFGFPSPFKTKREAMERAGDWVRAINPIARGQS